MSRLGLHVPEQRVRIVLALTTLRMSGIQGECHVVKIPYPRDEGQTVRALNRLVLKHMVPGIIAVRGCVLVAIRALRALAIAEEGGFIHVQPEAIERYLLV